MSYNQEIQPEAPCPEPCCAGEQISVTDARQMEVKPLLKALAGLGLFFGAMTVIAAFGAMLVIAVKNLAKVF